MEGRFAMASHWRRGHDNIKINLDVDICIKDQKFIGGRKGEKYWKFCERNKWMALEHRGCTSRAQLLRDRERAQARLMSFWSTSSTSLNNSLFLLYLSLIMTLTMKLSLIKLQQLVQPLLETDMVIDQELVQKETPLGLNVV